MTYPGPSPRRPPAPAANPVPTAAPAPPAPPVPAPPVAAPTTTDIWCSLPTELLRPQYNNLGPVPLVPANLPAEMRAQVVQAHAAGVATAFGTLAQPIVPEPAAATVIWTYFHQGLQYGITQKMALASISGSASRTSGTPVTSKMVKIRDPDLFVGTDRSKLEVYKSQVRNKLRGNAAEFPDDSSQVSYAVSYLNGAAYA